MIYPWLKAAHIFAMVLWMGGTLFAGLYVARAARDGGCDEGSAVALRRWDRMVTTPSMLAVWLFGLAMAQSAGWWSFGWLQAKLVLVFVLSGVHGVLAGRLRRLSGASGDAHAERANLIAPATLCLLAAVILLATVKPF